MLDHNNLEAFSDPVNYDLEDPSDTGVAFYSALAQEAGGSVLEIACGTGRVTIPIAKLGFPTTGLDSVPGLYWVTETITPSMRDYFDNRWHGAAIESGTRVQVPMGFANFDKNYVSEGSPPREWVERLYDVRRWTAMPSGGHFGAAEEPERLARDIAAFFAEL